MLVREIIESIAALGYNDDEPDILLLKRILRYLNHCYIEVISLSNNSESITALGLDDDISLTPIGDNFANMLIWGTLFYLSFDERDKMFSVSASISNEKFEELKSRFIGSKFAKRTTALKITSY